MKVLRFLLPLICVIVLLSAYAATLTERSTEASLSISPSNFWLLDEYSSLGPAFLLLDGSFSHEVSEDLSLGENFSAWGSFVPMGVSGQSEVLSVLLSVLGTPKDINFTLFPNGSLEAGGLWGSYSLGSQISLKIYLNRTSANVTAAEFFLNGNLFSEENVTLGNQSWLPGFEYRCPVEVYNPNPFPLYNFQVLLTVDTQSLISAGEMNPNGSDIRFTSSDGITLLPYWIQSGLNTTSTKIWVLVPYLPPQGDALIYMYFGNKTAAPGQDPWEVFPFFWNGTLGGLTTYTSGWVLSLISVSQGDTLFAGYVVFSPADLNYFGFSNLGTNYTVVASLQPETAYGHDIGLAVWGNPNASVLTGPSVYISELGPSGTWAWGFINSSVSLVDNTTWSSSPGLTLGQNYTLEITETWNSTIFKVISPSEVSEEEIPYEMDISAVGFCQHISSGSFLEAGGYVHYLFVKKWAPQEPSAEIYPPVAVWETFKVLSVSLSGEGEIACFDFGCTNYTSYPGWANGTLENSALFVPLNYTEEGLFSSLPSGTSVTWTLDVGGTEDYFLDVSNPSPGWANGTLLFTCSFPISEIELPNGTPVHFWQYGEFVWANVSIPPSSSGSLRIVPGPGGGSPVGTFEFFTDFSSLQGITVTNSTGFLLENGTAILLPGSDNAGARTNLTFSPPLAVAYALKSNNTEGDWDAGIAVGPNPSLLDLLATDDIENNNTVGFNAMTLAITSGTTPDYENITSAVFSSTPRETSYLVYNVYVVKEIGGQALFVDENDGRSSTLSASISGYVWLFDDADQPYSEAIYDFLAVYVPNPGSAWTVFLPSLSALSGGFLLISGDSIQQSSSVSATGQVSTFYLLALSESSFEVEIPGGSFTLILKEKVAPQ